MGTIVVKSAVKREKGYLYYIDGAGNVCRAKMANGKKATTKKVAPKKRVAKKVAKKTTRKK